MKPEILHNDHMMFLDRSLDTQRTALLTAMADAVAECRTLLPAGPRSKKKSGTPMSAPQPKQTSCLLVKLNATLVLTFVRSLGTGT